MTTLPAYSRSDFQRGVALDMIALWGALGTNEGCGCDAIYRVQGQGAGVLVRVYVSQKTTAQLSAGVGQAGSIVAGVTGQQRRFWLCALVAEPGLVVTGGVATDGGIKELARQDTFELAGILGGDPTQTTIVLKVGSKPRIVNGVEWGAEVTP